MIFSLIMSFTQYDVINNAHWAGLSNYKELATDPLFYKSFYNTAYMALGVPLGIIVGLGLAILLDAGVRGLSAYRTLFYLPAIVPAVAASILWIWVFHPTGGLINSMLGATGSTTGLLSTAMMRRSSGSIGGYGQARPDPHGPVEGGGGHAHLAGWPQERSRGTVRGGAHGRGRGRCGDSAISRCRCSRRISSST